MSFRASLSIFSFLLFLGCTRAPQNPRPLGEAFVGPITLNLRQELAPRSPVAATVKHGERLQIIQTRRRWVRVRTEQGAEGWTDSKNLLSTDQMSGLKSFSERSTHLPSQGAATVYEPLNMHTAPNRSSPSFHQITEGVKVDVIGHVVAPRVPFEAPSLLPPKPTPKSNPKSRKKERGPKYPLPMPPAPRPPDNWLDLSKSAAPEADPEEVKKAAPPPARKDDWSLVRTGDGKAGWVLTRMLTMAIPDEVAQYAEGARITSYFSLGEVRDGEEIKHNWLWTTLSKTAEPYEFDSFRVFTWSLRRHRYETTYIERKVKGYYPVKPHPVAVTMNRTRVNFPGFSLILEDSQDSRLYRQTYVFEGYRVRLIAKTPWEPPSETPLVPAAASSNSQDHSGAQPWYVRWKRRWDEWRDSSRN